MLQLTRSSLGLKRFDSLQKELEDVRFPLVEPVSKDLEPAQRPKAEKDGSKNLRSRLNSSRDNSSPKIVLFGLLDS